MAQVVVAVESPVYQCNYENDAGTDLAIASDVDLKPGNTYKIPINNRFVIPVGYKAIVHPRSSTAVNWILIHNTVIDAEYTGPLYIIASNLTQRKLSYSRNDRIAQLVFSPVIKPKFVVMHDADCEVSDITEHTTCTKSIERTRNNRGFGSAGLNTDWWNYNSV